MQPTLPIQASIPTLSSLMRNGRFSLNELEKLRQTVSKESVNTEENQVMA